MSYRERLRQNFRISHACLLSSFAILLIAPAAFAQEAPEVERLIKGMPKAVAALISRRVECNHWGGEEAYDHERAKQIENAVKPLMCDRLDLDENKLLAKYKNNPKIIKAIGASREIYL